METDNVDNKHLHSLTAFIYNETFLFYAIKSRKKGKIYHFISMMFSCFLSDRIKLNTNHYFTKLSYLLEISLCIDFLK